MPDGYTMSIENLAATTIRQLQRGDQVGVCKCIGALAIQSHPPGGIRNANANNVRHVRIAGFRVAYIVDDAACAITITRIADERTSSDEQAGCHRRSSYPAYEVLIRRLS